MNSSSQKQTSRQLLRKSIREKRQSLNKSQQQIASKSLLLQLQSHKNVQQAEHVAVYLANDSELDVMSFIRWCWQENKSVYLPVIHPFSKGHLLFLKYENTTKMQINQYGINEPKLDVTAIKQVADIDIICTPLVAFDTKGNRLGMGGGFYDRTLALWHEEYKSNASVKPYPIGLAHDCQCVPNIPSEFWDVPLPEIITPTHRYIF